MKRWLWAGAMLSLLVAGCDLPTRVKARMDEWRVARTDLAPCPG